MRIIFVIFVSVAAGVLVRYVASENRGSQAFSQPDSNADAAVGLREISAATQPSKSWAVDFAAYVSTHPGQWVVGHCAQPCLSENEAGRQARADAAKIVWPMVALRLGIPSGETNSVRQRVEADVLAGKFDANTLAEQFQRPYGTVWTESVLMDVSPARLDAVAKSFRGEISNWRNRQTSIRQVVLASMVAAWLAYPLLNAVTRGYFTTRLRLAAGVLTAVGVALLV